MQNETSIEEFKRDMRRGFSEQTGRYFESCCLRNLEREFKGDITMSVENCGQVETRVGQVNQELNNAENAASRLVARIDELEKQLSQVLHPSDPPSSKPAEAKEPKIPLVPLASCIESHYILLQTLETRVGGILDRLEIR